MSSIRSLTLLASVIAALAPSPAVAQELVGLRVEVSAGTAPLAAAMVRVGARAGLTDSSGVASFGLPPGTYEVRVEKLGYAPARASVTLSAGAPTRVEVTILEQAESLEGIIVTSTRSRGDKRIEDEPLRVEVLAEEEVEEKLMMTPGDIAMMLNETSGLRVQNTSPSLGGSNVRVQGLRGRYTQILSDGLPLYGGQSGSLGMLQIPPMDLGQVEVIKGVASALYGSSALGGVVNLISRRPEPLTEILLNQTTLGGSDAILYSGGEPSERLGYTMLASIHNQRQADVDEDGWADLASYRRAVVRPRVFWDDGEGRSMFVTLGGTLEDRIGGTRDGRTTPAGTAFMDGLETVRMDAGTVGRVLIGEVGLLTVRGSLTSQRHEHRFGDVLERDLHTTAFAEASYAGETRGHAWVVGAAFQRDAFEAEDADGFDYGYTAPSLFVQDEITPVDWLTLAASARLDAHSEYGTFVNPRLSLLGRPGRWTVRASAGTGYFAPTPFTEETEAVGLLRVVPPGGLEAERGRGASLDVARSIGNLEVNGTLFGSIIDDPVKTRVSGDRLVLENAPGATRTRGGELLARWNREPLHLTATYTFVHSTEISDDGRERQLVPLTPRHSAGLVGMWEWEGEGRIGLEVYYTGAQPLEDNPYRSEGRPYVVTGALFERRVGRARIFLNAENLLDARQTRHDSLLLPARSATGRWTTDAWAPLDGRVLNAGVRYEL